MVSTQKDLSFNQTLLPCIHPFAYPFVRCRNFYESIHVRFLVPFSIDVHMVNISGPFHPSLPWSLCSQVNVSILLLIIKVLPFFPLSLEFALISALFTFRTRANLTTSLSDEETVESSTLLSVVEVGTIRARTIFLRWRLASEVLTAVIGTRFRVTRTRGISTGGFSVFGVGSPSSATQNTNDIRLISPTIRSSLDHQRVDRILSLCCVLLYE